ncbi:flagellar hook-associated protein FlgK [Alkalicella caledoniensis]|uniref:Flagellar hook-associated protein 1 n=1 Tax=Alkalicella caledoniensis TaxID=2731377 RepID=A0A7G9W714_ALKCA|nr:flagellar hook-associated protein FlgK [Alkalicella caledoniensis]QNO14476.1 flagellar hook-associated protein FlgK [Alkalicella caledoniensis]
MRSTFSGLELARRALQTQQTALNTVGHNISNANTPGYSRQEVVTSPTGPYTSPSNIRPMAAGHIGTGVAVVSIQRQFDKYVANQWRLENGLLAQWNQKQLAMQQIESIFNEPSESSLRMAVDEFWSALNQLAIEPTELSSRALVKQTAITMVDTFKTMDRQLDQISKDYDELGRAAVSEINSLVKQIEDVNKRIVRSTAMGDQPNDLLDQRDLLLDKLTELVNVDMEENNRGDMRISFGGHVLVPYVGENHESLKFNYHNEQMTLVRSSDDVVVLTHTQVENNITHGKVKGIFESKEAIAKYQDYLEEYAMGYVNALNAQHNQGVGLNGQTDIDFFVTTLDGEGNPIPGIKGLAVNPAIINDLGLIAASASGAKGDGTNAVELAALRHGGNLEYAGQNVTFDQFYRAVIADLGIETDETIKMTDNQKILAYQFELRQEQFRGVSLDEEMTKMVQYQHSYAAAARLTTAIDEMIDVIVNRLGIVGR